jgi:hypothetical protein
MDPVVVRLTDEDRHRTLPTTVELTDEDKATAGLTAQTWALCHEVLTMPLHDLDPAPKGDITLGTMIAVERALLHVFDLEEPPATGA